MAHNLMRVDSTNDRYITETMIDLNLNLNEEIDFDFFDNVETPSKRLDPKKNNSGSISRPRSCSPQPSEDDDDVQTSLHPFSRDLRKNEISETIKDINTSSDSIEEPLSTGTDNNEKFTDNFVECDPSEELKDLNIKLFDKATEVTFTTSCSSATEISSQEFLLQKDNSMDDLILSNPYVRLEHDVLSSKASKSDDDPLGSSFCKGSKEDALSQKLTLDQASIKSNEVLSEDALSKSSKSQSDLTNSKGTQDDAVYNFIKSHNEADSVKSGENYEEDALSKSSRSQKVEGSGSGYDSDEGCLFEGSDSDELLIGVHTLTIIPHDNDEDSVPCPSSMCEETSKAKENEMIHSTSSEIAAVTARSSSGYSSASCKAHGCVLSRCNKVKADSRQSPKLKMRTPDIDEFIKSFRKMQSSPRISLPDKFSTLKKQPRRNMSFSNEELKRIERENAILLNKIVIQQRTRPAVVHKYERRVTSNAINRARQSKKIEYDNEILLKKIQDVKRKSILSAQSSRCISQASTSQF